MLVGKRIGPDTVDDIINVIGFHRHLREPVQHLLATLPGRLVQQCVIQILLLGKVINGGAVAHHAGGVHGHLVGVAQKGRQRPAGGHSEPAALRHEILQRLPVPGRQIRHRLAAAQSSLGVDQRVVKVTGQQYAVEFSHGHSPFM